MNLRRSVIDSLQWMTVARIAGQAVTWAVTFIVMRILDPEDYGLMALALVPLGLLQLLDELGLGSALVQRRDLEEGLLEKVLGALIAINGAMFAVMIVLSPVVAAGFNQPRLSVIIQVLSVRLLIMPFSIVPESILRRNLRFRVKSIVDFLQMLVNGGVTLGMALAGFGVWALVGGAIAAGLFRAAGMTIAAGSVVIPSFRLSGLSEVVQFGGYVTGARVLWYLYSQSDVVIIGRVLGEVVLGYYTLAMSIATIPMTRVAGVLNEVGFSAFSRIQDDPVEVAAKFRKAARVLSFFAFPVFLGISAVAPEIVRVFLVPKWYPAIFALQVVALAVPLRMLATLTAPALFGVGRPHVNMTNVLIACVIMPTSFFVGSFWGLDGVALAWLISYPVLFAIMMGRSLPVLGVRWAEYLADIRDPLAAGVLMYAIVALTRYAMSSAVLPRGVDLAILVVVGTVVYGCHMLLVRRAHFREVLGLARR